MIRSNLPNITPERAQIANRTIRNFALAMFLCFSGWALCIGFVCAIAILEMKWLHMTHVVDLLFTKGRDGTLQIKSMVNISLYVLPILSVACVFKYLEKRSHRAVKELTRGKKHR